jgi:DNA-nicking Smr family endonuclease
VRKRALSEEERALWRLATRDVARSERRDKRSSEGPPPPAKLPGMRAGASPAPLPGKAPVAKTRPPRALGAGDPARDRLAASGRIAIDRIVDLHGLTEIGAHRVVRRALADAAAKGERLLLVITGKGRRAGGDDAEEPMRAGRGVIRRRFLDWIDEPDLRILIARVAQARPKDGGAGAFYVFVKKKGAGNRRP